MYRAPPSQELCTWSSYEIAWLANLSPLCINHTLTSTDTRTETFWSALSATHESQIYFRSNPVRAILKLVKISYTFVSLPYFDRVNAISTTKFLNQLVTMNCNESDQHFLPSSSVSLSCNAWNKGFPMEWWCFWNMMNFKKRTKTSNYALIQFFNIFSVKFGAFVPSGTALPRACYLGAQTRTQL